MFAKSLLASSILGSALAAPALMARQGERWTLTQFHRACNDEFNNCSYDFGVDENNGIKEVCKYTIPGNGQPARQANYEKQICGRFSINQGYDQRGFITVVVDDTISKKRSYFGYSNDELKDGITVTPDHTSDASAVNFKRQAAGWKVTGFTRECNPDNTCSYAFTIEDGASHACSFVAPGAGDASFSHTPCSEDANWAISWGYNQSAGSAVMTVINKAANQDAFFGWDNVNSSKGLPDVGPNPVYNI